MKKISLVLLLITIFIAPIVLISSVSADSDIGPILINPLCPQNDPNCANSDVNGLLNSIVDWLLIIATPIAVGMILFGAFQMLFSGGNEETFKKGRTTILYTAIGYAIILVGKGLTSIIQDLLSH